MAQMCTSMTRECTGCMACQNDNDPIMHDYDGTPIYAGDYYYEIDGDIIHEDNLTDYCDQFKQEARHG